MPAGDIYEAKMFSRHTDQVAVTRRYYRSENQAGTGATQAQVTTAIANQLATVFSTMLNTAAEYRGMTVQRIVPQPRTVESTSLFGAGFGLEVGDCLPRQVRGILSLRTAFAGRQYRGRLYIPFPGEGSNDADATPTAAYLVKLNAFGAAVIATLAGVGGGGNTEDLKPVLCGFAAGNPVPIRVNELANYLARDRWATQRRSGSYGRPNISPL